MATAAARLAARIKPGDASPEQGHRPVNRARDVHVSDHGQVHIGNNYGTSAQTELHRRQNKVLKNLSTVPYEDRKNVNPPRVPGTCKWFLGHPLYRQWREGSRPLLWVSAEPGCGKSVLSRFLIDDELSTEPCSEVSTDHTICYFFFKDGIQDQRSLQDALKCILKQLFLQKRNLLSHSVLDRFETEGYLSASTLWRVLMQAISKPEVDQTVILLDAVDECEEGSRHELYKLLEACSNIRPGVEPSRLRLFLTSRPSSEVRNGLCSLPVIHLEGETAEEADKIAEEIKLVIEREIELLCNRFQISPKQKMRLRSQMLSVDNRTYLWAHLTLDLIRKDLQAGKRDILTSRVGIPQSVEAAYDSMLSKSHSPSLAKRLLQIVLAATRPLSLAETAAVMEWSEDIPDDERNHEMTEEQQERRVRGLCGLFTVVGRKVSLLHQTVREFLIETFDTSNSVRNQQSLEWRHSISIRESHYILAKACVQSLLLNDDLIIGAEDPLSKEVDALWGYASLHWNHHARHSGFDDVISMQRLCEKSSADLSKTSWFHHHLSYHAQDQDFLINAIFTPIQIAAYCGVTTLVHHLLRVSDLNQVLSPLSRDGHFVSISAVSLAAGQGHSDIIEEVLGHFPSRIRHLLRLDPLMCRDFERRTPLGTAALHGHAKAVSVLLQEGSNIYEEDEDGSMPLINAFCSGQRSVIDILLAQQKKDLNMFDIDNQLRSLLVRAIHAGKKRAVRGILASERLDVNAALDQEFEHLKHLLLTNLGLDPAHFLSEPHGQPSSFLALAASKGDTDIVRILLESGANANAIGPHEMTPLHWAALLNHSDTVRLLIERGSNVNATNTLGFAPLALSRDLDTIHTLLDQGASLPGVRYCQQQLGDPALFAVKEHRLPANAASWLKPVLRATSLKEHAVFDDLVMVFTVFHGPDKLLDAITNYPWTADTPTCFEGWRMIHFAAAFDNAETKRLKKLLAAGVNPGARNLAMQAPLDVAAKFGNVQSVAEILSRLTSGLLSEKDLSFSRDSLINHSLESGSIQMIELILNSCICDGNTIGRLLENFHLVPNHAAISILELLLRWGVQLKGSGPILQGMLLRSYAREAFELLLSHGADPNEHSEGCTLLHRLAVPLSSYVPNERLAEVLLDHNADPCPRDAKGNTPLDVARSHELTSAFITLLERATTSPSVKRRKK